MPCIFRWDHVMSTWQKIQWKTWKFKTALQSLGKNVYLGYPLPIFTTTVFKFGGKMKLSLLILKAGIILCIDYMSVTIKEKVEKNW